VGPGPGGVKGGFGVQSALHKPLVGYGVSPGPNLFVLIQSFLPPISTHFHQSPGGGGGGGGGVFIQLALHSASVGNLISFLPKLAVNIQLWKPPVSIHLQANILGVPGPTGPLGPGGTTGGPGLSGSSLHSHQVNLIGTQLLSGSVQGFLLLRIFLSLQFFCISP
jgi:hypothetical protein